MAHRLHRTLLVVLASFAMFGATLLVVPTAQAAGSGQIVGRITDAATHKGLSKIRVQVFTSTWGYIGEVKAKKSGIYRISSREIGGYHLKFVDTRPRFDTSAHVTKEAYVRVTQTDDPTVKNVKMHQGATVYGTVKLKKGRAKGARVVAANDFGAYEVTADNKGRFAVGGMAPGKYTVFAWDAKGTYTGSPKYVGKVKAGRSKGVVVKLKTRSGGLSGILTVDGRQAFETVYVTAVNKSSGQWWTQKITYGDLSALQGLAPGKYKLIVPGFQGHVGRTVTLSAKVASGKTRDIFPVNLGTRGGVVAGKVVKDTTGQPLAQIAVSLYDTQGTLIQRVSTGTSGTFSVGGTVATAKGLTLVIEAEHQIRNDHDQGVKTYAKITKTVAVTNETTTNLGTIVLRPA